VPTHCGDGRAKIKARPDGSSRLNQVAPRLVARTGAAIFAESKEGGRSMVQSGAVRRWVSVLVGVAALGAIRLASAQGPAPQTLIFAVYDNEKAAKDAFAAMKDGQRKGLIQIDSYAVVSKDQKGRVHVKSTQRRHARTGAIVGALVGVLGGPIGMAAGAAAGGGIGYLTGNAVGIPREKIEEMKSSLDPGMSGIVAVVEERWVADLEASLRAAHAVQVLDYKIANPTPGAPADNEGTPPPAEGTQPPPTP